MKFEAKRSRACSLIISANIVQICEVVRPAQPWPQSPTSPVGSARNERLLRRSNRGAICPGPFSLPCQARARCPGRSRQPSEKTSSASSWRVFEDAETPCNIVCGTRDNARSQRRPLPRPSLCWASSAEAKALDRDRECTRNRCGTIFPMWSEANYRDDDRRRPGRTWWCNNRLENFRDIFFTIFSEKQEKKFLFFAFCYFFIGRSTHRSFSRTCPSLPEQLRTVRFPTDGVSGKSSISIPRLPKLRRPWSTRWTGGIRASCSSLKP